MKFFYIETEIVLFKKNIFPIKIQLKVPNPFSNSKKYTSSVQKKYFPN